MAGAGKEARASRLAEVKGTNIMNDKKNEIRAVNDDAKGISLFNLPQITDEAWERLTNEHAEAL